MNLNVIYRHLSTPTIFRHEFNQAQTLSVTQAWSLFFTAGQNVDGLGTDPDLGKSFTNILLRVVVTGAVGSLIYFQGV